MSRQGFGEGRDVYNSARRAYGLSALSHPFEQLERATGLLILSSENFDFSSSEKNAHMVYAGPELGDPLWANPWSAPWNADDKRPLVLVGLSSTFQDQKEVLCRIALALAELDIRVVMTSGPAIEPREIPAAPNVHICQSAPHGEILREAAVMVTHAGHGSVMRGLAAGVPLLCIPMGRDQHDNAARVTYRGAGIALSSSPSSDEIADGVRSLLKDASYRENAARLGERLRYEYEHSTAVDNLEQWAAQVAQRSMSREVCL